MDVVQTGLEILPGCLAGSFVIAIALQNPAARLNWQKWMALLLGVIVLKVVTTILPLVPEIAAALEWGCYISMVTIPIVITKVFLATPKSKGSLYRNAVLAMGCLFETMTVVGIVALVFFGHWFLSHTGLSKIQGHDGSTYYVETDYNLGGEYAGSTIYRPIFIFMTEVERTNCQVTGKVHLSTLESHLGGSVESGTCERVL